MQNLFDLAQIVKNIDVKSTDLLSSNTKRKSKANTFFQKILNQDFSTDTDASAFLFQSNPNHTGYKNLKYSLREKLISTFFFYKPKKNASDLEKSIVYCTKYYMAGQLLIRLGAKGVGIDLCQKVFRKAMEVELTEFIFLTSKELRREMSLIQGNIEKYHYYNAIYKEFKEILDIEGLAEEYYCQIVSPYIKSVEYQSDTSKIAQLKYDELSHYLDKFSSPRLHLLARNIHVIAKFNNKDYLNTVKICEDALSFFENKNYTYYTAIRAFIHHMLICYIQLKNYTKGKEVLKRTLSIIKPGTYNWFVNQELHLLLAVHSKEYNEAFQIVQVATSHYRFKNIRQDLREKWQINRAYIYFLTYIDKVTIEKDKVKNIRLGKLLNSVPIYSKDKRGMNIPILIIQILFMIVKKDYDQIIDRFEAIQKYCSRYLRKDDNLRSNCFINMLLQIPKANFHKAGVERKAKKYYETLLATPLEVANQAHEIEIIPYEDLWGFILESLETKFHRAK